MDMVPASAEPLLHPEQCQLRPSDHRRWWVLVAAALLLMLLVTVGPLHPMLFGVPQSEPVALILLTAAQEKGAVCLDGTPPGYHLQRGSDFYNWNKAYVRYCDGASFSGDAEGQAEDGTILHFRGLRIYQAVIDELMEKGLANATQAILTGCSAGGLATFVHCDDFSARFSHKVSVKCLVDAGFILDVKDISGQRSFRSLYGGVVHLQNVRQVLPKDCLTNKEPTECFFPAELIKSIHTPMFIVNSGYDPAQTVAEAVGDWHHGRTQGVKEVDCKYPCNPTCNSQSPL
uniref:Pectin acetylesterase n=1 Tax=Aegilops tauschii TaxID=37682 RepID=M8D132_AEGTA